MAANRIYNVYNIKEVAGLEKDNDKSSFYTYSYLRINNFYMFDVFLYLAVIFVSQV